MRKKALLINDSKFESLILRDMLNQLEYDVEIADEFDALYEVEQFSPDLVIVNYIMQDTTGDELIERIKDGQPSVKCILSSSNDIKKSNFQDTSVDGVLRTPVSMFTLKDVLIRLGEYNFEPEATLKEIVIQVPTEHKRFCDHCNKDISTFEQQFVFCPFCGEELDAL